MAVRPYILMPYFAAILLVTTTLMIVTFTGQTLGVAETATTKNLTELITVFTSACVFHTYLIGLVAGKISEESVSAGFKHSAILVLIAILTAKLVPMFITF